MAVVVVYTAEYVSGTVEVNEEHLEAKLFSRDEIPWEELAFPSTRDALKDYLKNKETIPCC
jgi:hypothetical protein